MKLLSTLLRVVLTSPITVPMLVTADLLPPRSRVGDWLVIIAFKIMGLG